MKRKGILRSLLIIVILATILITTSIPVIAATPSITIENNPALTVVKTANVMYAIPGETVEYTIEIQNTGDCILGITVVDPLLNIDQYFRLDAGATKTIITSYLVDCDDPWKIENTVTVNAIHSQGEIGPYTDTVEVITMATRSLGYWKTHANEDVWGTSQDNIDNNLLILPGTGGQDDGLNPIEMLIAQYTAAYQNVYRFDNLFCYDRYPRINTAIDVTLVLIWEIYQDMGIPLPDEADFDAYWDSLSKSEQRELKQQIAPLKDYFETFNTLGDWYWE